MDDSINQGILEVVKLLNNLGYETCDSGDGETHDYECDRDVGYVVVRLSERDDLERCAEDICKELQKRGVEFGQEDGQVLIQANYGPLDKLKLVDIHGIHDRMLTK